MEYHFEHPLFLNIFDGQSTNPDILTDMTLKRGMLAKKKLDMEAGTAWFHNIVKKFYENNMNLPSTYLQQLNKTTISFMINDLKTMNTSQANELPPTFYESHTVVNEKKLNMDLVEKRQQEYQNMFKKPVPPEIDFREKIPENSGRKVDDLLQQHIQKREAELKQYAPPILPPDQAMVQTREAVKNMPPVSKNVTISVQDSEISPPPPPANLDAILQLLKPVETREPRAIDQPQSSTMDDMSLPVTRREFMTFADSLNSIAQKLENLTELMLRNSERRNVEIHSKLPEKTETTVSESEIDIAPPKEEQMITGTTGAGWGAAVDEGVTSGWVELRTLQLKQMDNESKEELQEK
jgi:hypothetical protein